MSEKNYDFRIRHWQYHRLNMRNCERTAQANEILLDESWKIGCCKNAGPITRIAVDDFRDYLAVSMNLALDCTHEKAAMCCGLKLTRVWKTVLRWKPTALILQ